MSNNTKIDWCDATCNPVIGCPRGCEYCYARKMNAYCLFCGETILANELTEVDGCLCRVCPDCKDLMDKYGWRYVEKLRNDEMEIDKLLKGDKDVL